MKTIYFKIENKTCEETGYIEIYDSDYMPDWYYWNDTGYQSQEKIYHKYEKITGLSDKQIKEIEEFKHLINNKYVDWILEFIFTVNENEKDFLQIGEITVKVGDEF